MPPLLSVAPGDQTTRLHDGRILGYAEYGVPQGRPLLYFHGHPGSRLEARFLAEPAARLGVRLIGVDRPGLGLSTFKPHRHILEWPADVAELADQLHLDRFAVVGFSGGSPYALACAYRLPQRLTACGVVAGVGRVSPFLAFLSQWLPWLLLPIIGRFFRTTAQAQKTLARAAQHWVEPDKESFLRPGIAELMAASLVEAQRPGARGAAYDGMLLGRSWGFKLEEVTFEPIYLWHGERDAEISVEVAREVAAKLPHCQATYYSGEGHISLIVNQAEMILKALA